MCIRDRSNTPRQILIYEALGYDVPTFAHLSMILGSDGHKLSKRHGAASVEEFRDNGFLPDTMVNFLAPVSYTHLRSPTCRPCGVGTPAEALRTRRRRRGT